MLGLKKEENKHSLNPARSSYVHVPGQLPPGPLRGAWLLVAGDLRLLARLLVAGGARLLLAGGSWLLVGAGVAGGGVGS